MFQTTYSSQSTLFHIEQFGAQAFSCLGGENGVPSSVPPRDGSIATRVFAQPFTQKLEVFFPVGDVGVGYKLAPIMEPRSKHFYAVKQSPMDFTTPAFKAFKKELGSLSALSVGRRIDVDDVFAVYLSGELGLSLTKDTFITTGFATSNEVAGHRKHTQSPAYSEIAPSYVSIDLDSETPHKQAEFVHNARMIPPTTFFMTWESKTSPNGPNSASTRAQEEKSAQLLFPSLKRLLLNSERKTLRGLQVPIIDIASLLKVQEVTLDSHAKPEPRSFARLANRSVPQDDPTDQKVLKKVINDGLAEEIIEWIGAMHCRVRNYMEGTEIDPSVSLVTPSGEIEKAPMHGLVFCHDGFLDAYLILHQIKQAKAIVDAGHAPYAVVTAWAFIDQPLHTGLHLHDAHYTIVILTDDHYIWISPTQS